MGWVWMFTAFAEGPCDDGESLRFTCTFEERHWGFESMSVCETTHTAYPEPIRPRGPDESVERYLSTLDTYQHHAYHLHLLPRDPYVTHASATGLEGAHRLFRWEVSGEVSWHMLFGIARRETWSLVGSRDRFVFHRFDARAESFVARCASTRGTLFDTASLPAASDRYIEAAYIAVVRWALERRCGNTEQYRRAAQLASWTDATTRPGLTEPRRREAEGLDNAFRFACLRPPDPPRWYPIVEW